MGNARNRVTRAFLIAAVVSGGLLVGVATSTPASAAGETNTGFFHTCGNIGSGNFGEGNFGQGNFGEGNFGFFNIGNPNIGFNNFGFFDRCNGAIGIG